jgi:hypothetical protein
VQDSRNDGVLLFYVDGRRGACWRLVTGRLNSIDMIVQQCVSIPQSEKSGLFSTLQVVDIISWVWP